MIRVYGFPNTRTIRVTWALEEAGAEYDLINVNLAQGEHKKPGYLKINPGGKVPAFVDGDLLLTESPAIATYIGEKFPATGLVPAEPLARAHYFQWCFFAISELEAPLWLRAKHASSLPILPEERRVPAIADTCDWEFQRAADLLAQHLKGREFAIGNAFTAADILLAGTLNWARRQGIGLQSSVLDDYADRMTSRPALARARDRESQLLSQ